MKQQNTFVGWDFENVWGIDENVTYPYFRPNITTIIPINLLPSAPVESIQMLPAASGSMMNVDIEANFNAELSNVTLWVADYKDNKLVQIYQTSTPTDEPKNSLVIRDIPKTMLNDTAKLMIWDSNSMTPYIETVFLGEYTE